MILANFPKFLAFFLLAALHISCVFQDNDDIEIEWLTYEEYPYFSTFTSESGLDFELIENKRIWSRGGHNAFTDIISFGDYIYVVFREASCCHFSEDGKARIIRSKDTIVWEDVAVLAVPDKDVRDPKFSICPNNTLCLNATARQYVRLNEFNTNFIHQSYVWNSHNGVNWTDAQPVLHSNYWLWRVRWDKEINQAYGFSYRTGGNNYLSLHSSHDGVDFITKKYKIFDDDWPNETDLVFINDSTAISLVRRSPNSNSIIGLSRKPFIEWRWEELNEKIASPNLLLLPDKRIIAGVRYLEPSARTSISLIDPVEKKITEILQLPSGGDNGYPGMILQDDTLIVSYYSSHEKRTSIYLAKIKLHLD